ncbi:hypothetical protein BCR33DRAFT_826249 [Rhizoclosmatium globosum]|uniref:Uncharacterized protein n=1 Tax=Rhizoclosmatium globosum TaxID=329046 RepID=A0A1Y2C365_9FUNG|nr:hypothetical protein BCR33DRAFT_826249 [Rhizoclosmatium globosum]|eukprot:ORY41327.1 hypothetical protein BCR33DRAFT_826249 [Rhizoclosmatium globosum]
MSNEFKVWTQLSEGSWKCNVCNSIINQNLVASVQKRHESSQTHIRKVSKILYQSTVSKDSSKESVSGVASGVSGNIEEGIRKEEPLENREINVIESANIEEIETEHLNDIEIGDVAAIEQNTTVNVDTEFETKYVSDLETQQLKDVREDNKKGDNEVETETEGSDEIPFFAMLFESDVGSEDPDFSNNEDSSTDSDSNEAHEQLEDDDLVADPPIPGAAYEKLKKGWYHDPDVAQFAQGKYFPFASELEYEVTDLYTKTGAATISRYLQNRISKVFRSCKPPTHSRILKLRSNIRELLNYNPVAFELDEGRIVYYIPIIASLRLAFANPKTRSLLKVLPVDTEIQMELYHSKKWLNEIKTPMVRLSQTGLDVFVDELYKLSESDGFLPTTFFEDSRGKIFAVGHHCILGPNTVLVKNHLYKVEVNNIIEYFQCTNLVKIVFECGKSATLRNFEQSMRNGSALRLRACGRRVFNVPITLFNDDTSGNESKKWNKYESILFTLAGLPFKESQLQHNIFFVCTSKDFKAIESGVVVVNCMRELRTGVVVYDSYLREEVLIIGKFLGLYHISHLILGVIMQNVGDNPALSAQVSHSGTKSNHPCRICKVITPSTAPELLNFLKKPDAAFNIFQETKEILINLKRKHQADKLSINQVKKVLKENSISDTFFSKFLENNMQVPWMNPFLGYVGEEPFTEGALDTPVELLHCVLLGIVKYATIATITRIPDTTDLKSAIEGIAQDGLATKLRGHYMVRNNIHFYSSYAPVQVHYVGSRNGKDFRSFIQIAPFVFQNIVSNAELTVWKSLSHLTAMLYATTVSPDYETNVNNALDFFIVNASATPLFADLVKPKLHLLRHVTLFTDRYGPLVGSATENFEGSNKIIRSVLIHSDRQDTSKDTAVTFATTRSLQHLGDGGYYRLHGAYHSNLALVRVIERATIPHQIHTDSFVAVILSNTTQFYKVCEVEKSRVTGVEYVLNGSYHLDCPIIEITNTTNMFDIAQATLINVQHHCRDACQIRNKRSTTEGSRHKQYISHIGNEEYIINLCSFKTRRMLEHLVQITEPVSPSTFETAVKTGFKLMQEKREVAKAQSRAKRQAKHRHEPAVAIQVTATQPTRMSTRAKKHVVTANSSSSDSE